MLLQLQTADAVCWRGLDCCLHAAGVAGVWRLRACLLQHTTLLGSSFVSLLCTLTNFIFFPPPPLLPYAFLSDISQYFTDGDKRKCRSGLNDFSKKF